MAKLFSEFIIKDMQLKNRIVMAPMCMNSADDNGHIQDFHYVHYITRAVGGAGLIILEATAVESRGRILDRDLGIWEDSHVEGLKKLVEAIKKYDIKIGIQLGHAGRKCLLKDEDIIAPSAIAFDSDSRTPKEMTKEDIKAVINDFKLGALRAKEAGFDMIEIHAAHGYLINEFMSPLTNKRKDEYGGNAENRARFLKEIIKAIREVWPKEKPLFVRVSAEDYNEDGNTSEDTAELINLVKAEGIDVIDVSSGAVVPAYIKAFPGYQVKFAETIRAMCDLPVIAGGLLTNASICEEIIQNERADLVFIGRELLRNPYWTMKAAEELRYDLEWPEQYSRAKI